MPRNGRKTPGCSGTPIALGAILLAFTLASACCAAAQAPIRKSVLVINEVGISHPLTIAISQQILSVLQANSRYQIEFYNETLDSMSFPDAPSHQEIRAWILRKYRNREVDVIVAIGPEPIRFMAQSPKDFFPDVPVVVCASSAAQVADVNLDARFTGVWTKIDPAKTIDAARDFLPDTRQVYVVGGSSEYDKRAAAVARQALAGYDSTLTFTYLLGLRMSDLLDKLRSLPEHSIVLYTSFFRDGAGQQFLNQTAALPVISQASIAPTFGTIDTNLGHGIVGGYVRKITAQGTYAAGIISQLLGGKTASEIPFVTAPNAYEFDWKQLQRWHLSENRLPPGSVIVNRESSLWEEAPWLIVGGALAIITLASLLGYVLYKQRQLARARREQTQLSGMLINAQEEERQRVATELHDDFSQRLALLSLSIENVAELIPPNCKQANEQLNDLLNSASELGADLHTLSHRLHSSTLEKLGLVPGVGAFCKEFTSQKDIRVAFTHKDVPRSVSPEVALCLFRVVQEALRNVQKHSRASDAKVSLRRVNGHLHLAVSDNGAGFDLQDLEGKAGIGVLSMKQRALLIGGRFAIQSAPQMGTRVDVWAPCKAAPRVEDSGQPGPSGVEVTETENVHAVTRSHA